jgi:hypothetical protein
MESGRNGRVTNFFIGHGGSPREQRVFLGGNTAPAGLVTDYRAR